MSHIDAIVMGRGTYETLSHMTPWPYELPVIVLSSSLASLPIPEHLIGKVRFLNHLPEEAMALLKKEGHQHIYIDGGQIVQSFINSGLINKLIITRLPILLGNGRSLFGPIQQDIRLKHIQTITFPSGFVQSHYEI
ncbi:dihydrofolate reductase family protein [Providencia rettgeri]|nr:dihydrofolate reductase family protein [Providencia sp. M-8]